MPRKLSMTAQARASRKWKETNREANREYNKKYFETHSNNDFQKKHYEKVKDYQKQVRLLLRILNNHFS